MSSSTEFRAPDGGRTIQTAGATVHLKDYIRVLWAGRWIVLMVFAVITTLTAILTFLADDVFLGRAIMSLDMRTPNVIPGQMNTGPDWYQVQRYMNEQEKILKSRKLGERIVRRLRLDEHPSFKGGKDPAAAFMARVEVKPQRESNMFVISIAGRDPREVADWANAVVEEYKRLNIDENIDRAKELQRLIQEKLDPFRQLLSKSEEQMARYQSSTDQFIGEQSKSVISQQIERLTADYAQAQAERVNTESKLKGIENLLKQGLPLETYPEVISNPTVQELNAERTKAELELSELKKTFKEGHPKVREIRTKLDELNGKVRSEINRIISSIRSDFTVKKEREDALLLKIQSLKDEAISAGQKNLELEKLKREYSQYKGFYETMLQRSKEIDISGTMAINNVRVIEPAIPPNGPIRPRRRFNIMVAGIGSLLLGLGIVFFLDYLDQSIKYPEDIEKHFGLTVLTTIPRYTPERVRVIRELYQTMRTSLIFSRTGPGPQTVLVTSSGPGEGKTTTSFNLAKILSAAGDRVVLVDCDLRRPSVHKHISVQNTKGVTSFIFQQASLEEILRPTDAENFKVITSGPLPPNPPEMFGKKEFTAFLDELRKSFDWVLLDTPPVASVTDPVIICSAADMVILVIRYNALDRRVIATVLKSLSAAKARIIGAVLNNIDVDRDTYYSSSYYYYYYRSGYYSEDALPASARTAKIGDRIASIRRGKSGDGAPAPRDARGARAGRKS